MLVLFYLSVIRFSLLFCSKCIRISETRRWIVNAFCSSLITKGGAIFRKETRVYLKRSLGQVLLWGHHHLNCIFSPSNMLWVFPEQDLSPTTLSWGNLYFVFSDISLILAVKLDSCTRTRRRKSTKVSLFPHVCRSTTPYATSRPWLATSLFLQPMI